MNRPAPLLHQGAGPRPVKVDAFPCPVHDDGKHVWEPNPTDRDIERCACGNARWFGYGSVDA